MTNRRGALRGAILVALASSALAGAASASSTVDELRAAIAAEPASPMLGARLTELAEALLAGLSTDAADTACLFGIPTMEQENRARAAATDALDAARRAAPALDTAVAALAADPGFADRRDLQDLRSELAVADRLIRLPIVRARAAAILASVASARSDARDLAHEATAALDILEPGSVVAESAALSLRFSNAGLSGATRARADRLLAIAHDEGAIAEIHAASPALAREVIAAAALALADSGDVSGAGALVTGALLARSTDPLDGIVGRDALAAMVVRDHAAPITGAIRALTSGAARKDDALAALALAKVRRLIDPTTPITGLPAAGQLALAGLLDEQGRSGDSIKALQAAWGALQPAGGALARRAGWSLAAALRARGGIADAADAGRILLSLAKMEPAPDRAESALVSAVALLRWAHAAAHARPGGPSPEEIEPSLKQALTRALARRPHAHSADTWRLALAEISSGPARRDLLGAIAPGSETYVHAQLALAWIEHAAAQKTQSDASREARAFAMLEHVGHAHDSARALGDDALTPLIAQAQAVALAELRRFDEAVRAALAWDDAGAPGAPDAVDFVRRRIAQAMEEAGTLALAERARSLAPALEAAARRTLTRVQAGRALRSLLGPAAVNLADALAAQSRATDIPAIIKPLADRFGLTRGLGVALATGLVSTDAQRAFAVCRDVVDASRALDLKDDLFWRAWAIMLGVLQSRNEDGARTETIVRQITRLRSEDPELGGGAAGKHLDEIERAAKSASPAHHP